MLKKAYEDDSVIFSEARRPHLTPQILIYAVKQTALERAPAALMDHLGPLKPSGVITRDRFIKNVAGSGWWVPGSKIETEDAALRLSNSLDAVLTFTKPQEQELSTRKRLFRAVQYHDQSRKSQAVMRQAATADRVGKNRGVAEFIQANPEVLIEITNYFILRDALDEYRPRRKGEEKENTDLNIEPEAQAMVLDYISKVNNHVLETIFDYIYDTLDNRARYWGWGLSEVKEHPLMIRFLNDRTTLPMPSTKPPLQHYTDNPKW